MYSSEFKPRVAMLEHLLAGHEITLLESQILFGEQALNNALTRFRRQGFIIKKRKVPLAKAITRANKYCELTAPKDLPIREISITEYLIHNIE